MQNPQQPIGPRSFLDWDSFSFGFVTQDESFESVVAIGSVGALIPYLMSVNTRAYQLLSGIGSTLAQTNRSLRVLDLRTQKDAEYVPTFGLGLAPIPGLTIQTLHNFPLLEANPLFELRIMKSNIATFLREANLGLTNPSLEPGPDNPPLKQRLPLTMAGLSSITILISLLNIYVYPLNRLYHDQRRFEFDELMRRHFSGIIEEENELRAQLPAWAGRSRMPILMDDAGGYRLDLLSIVSLARSPKRYSTPFDYHDFLALRRAREEILTTDLANYSERDIVRNAANTYDLLRENGQPYYRTDGSQAMG